MSRHKSRLGEQGLVADEGGVAYVEYVMVLALVTILGTVAVYSVGLPLFQTYRYAQLLIALPIP